MAEIWEQPTPDEVKSAIITLIMYYGPQLVGLLLGVVGLKRSGGSTVEAQAPVARPMASPGAGR